MRNTKLTYFEKIIHEMSGPIQTVHILSELMLQNPNSSGKTNAENLLHINDAAGKLRKVLGLLRSITNLKANKIDLQLEKMDLIKLAQEEIYHHQVQNKANLNLKIKVVSEVQSCQAETDEFWFKQLVSNLVINAINHCDKGIIEVSMNVVTKNNKEYFSLKVSDEGCGVAENELETIFLPMERGSHSIGKIPSSGIGLTVVKEVAEAHGGSDIARNNEKGGATFEITFPLK